MRIEGYSKESDSSYSREDASTIVVLDDVSISPGMCPLEGNCDFEDGLGCSWVQDQVNDNFDWLVVQADSIYNTGGPIYDHTNLAFDGKPHYHFSIFHPTIS